MATDNAYLSFSLRLDQGDEKDTTSALRSERGLGIELDDGQRIQLDPDDPRSVGYAQVLAQLQRDGRPVYLELAGGDRIERLLVPIVSRVARVSDEADGSISFLLEDSHARHVLRRDHPEFEAHERTLRESLIGLTPVVVASGDAHELIALRGFRPGPDGPFPELTWPLFPPELELHIPWWKKLWERIFIWPWWWLFCCVSQTRAQQVFDSMAATTCDPLTVPPPCIPFLYPDDGCWGRAHEMRRLMVAMGLSPKKVWIFGSLHVDTSNNPNCGVNWGWHVAPTLCVRTSFWFRTTMVIDPSLFTTPVTRATWKGVQGDTGATLDDTSGSIFHFSGNQTDPTYTKTNTVLNTYRGALQARALNQGPPPYACP